LEVLDPEQNHTFRDHYLGVPYDLSKVMFIATANLADGIPPALRDRMEILRLSGYSEEEKLAIALKFLVPKQVAESGLNAGEVSIGSDVLKKVVSEYTREAGLRELERLISQLARKLARRVVEAESDPAAKKKSRSKENLTVATTDLKALLGPPRYLADEQMESDEIGIATGLAWTPYGGEVLHIEAQTMAGKGNLILTGQLGDVMKESAQAALSFARAQALALGWGQGFFSEREIHIHVPAGGVPKDGPSAGVTIATVLISLMTGIPIRKDVAMTGELTLRGRVLPIGGLKEKLLAAVRLGIKTVIIPAANESELSEVPEHLLAKLKVVPARTMKDVLAVALLRPIERFNEKKSGGKKPEVVSPAKLTKATKATKPVATKTTVKTSKTVRAVANVKANGARKSSGRRATSAGA
jgi:ATP-dependent Lon protease